MTEYTEKEIYEDWKQLLESTKNIDQLDIVAKMINKNEQNEKIKARLRNVFILHKKKLKTI